MEKLSHYEMIRAIAMYLAIQSNSGNVGVNEVERTEANIETAKKIENYIRTGK